MQIDQSQTRITPYDQIGGEPAVKKLVEKFYDLMDADPDYYGIRKMHPPHTGRLARKTVQVPDGLAGRSAPL